MRIHCNHFTVSYMWEIPHFTTPHVTQIMSAINPTTTHWFFLILYIGVCSIWLRISDVIGAKRIQNLILWLRREVRCNYLLNKQASIIDCHKPVLSKARSSAVSFALCHSMVVCPLKTVKPRPVQHCDLSQAPCINLVCSQAHSSIPSLCYEKQSTWTIFTSISWFV